ncbi:PXMP2/4 family protein 3 [Fopius arisanus]|uniref:PXMP2/4 family protein 3 n=1 Tax=Fopius arisanus TaxID=64838 RepID=A0A9R1TB08_9HYME|nr:PREDICTED: PXMP2/4 family protein 3 [Fopius arisanus]
MVYQRLFRQCSKNRIAMSLSKPSQIILDIVGAYFNSLYMNPIRTKAITSCVLAVAGNYISQKISGTKEINHDSLLAFGLFGLLFGGPVPHYFYKYIHLFTKLPLGILLTERLVYTPLFQAFALYMLTRLEGKSHDESRKNMEKLYLPILLANYKYLTLLQFINIRYVPPMLRVLVVNFIGFAWTIYLANARSRASKKRKD